MRKAFIGLAMGALVLTGCGGSNSHQAKPYQYKTPKACPTGQVWMDEDGQAGCVPDVSAPVTATSGDVTTADGRSVRYPADGFTITLVSAQRYSSAAVARQIPGSYNVDKGSGPDVQPGYAAVKVMLKLTNPLTVPIPLADNQLMIVKVRVQPVRGAGCELGRGQRLRHGSQTYPGWSQVLDSGVGNFQDAHG